MEKTNALFKKKATIVKSYENGGLQAIDFDCLNGTLKIKWLKSFLTNTHSFWHCAPQELFKKFGGMDFVSRCDFAIQKLSVILSSFHLQVLLFWKLLYKHYFSPHDTPIWNCDSSFSGTDLYFSVSGWRRISGLLTTH